MTPRGWHVYAVWIPSALLWALLMCTSCSPPQPPCKTFVLKEVPPHLTDEVACTLASDFLHELNPAVKWEALAYSSTKAPDGQADKHLLRNGHDPNQGTVHFVSRSPQLDQVVAVRLVSNSVVCEVWRSK